MLARRAAPRSSPGTVTSPMRRVRRSTPDRPGTVRRRRRCRPDFHPGSTASMSAVQRPVEDDPLGAVRRRGGAAASTDRRNVSSSIGAEGGDEETARAGTVRASRRLTAPALGIPRPTGSRRSRALAAVAATTPTVVTTRRAAGGPSRPPPRCVRAATRAPTGRPGRRTAGASPEPSRSRRYTSPSAMGTPES